MTTGKLSIVIKMWLLFALAAIPESRVSEVAKPSDARTITNRKSGISKTGFPKKSRKRRKPEMASREHKKKL